MEIFALREEVDEISDAVEMKKKLSQLQAQQQSIEKQLATYFKSNRYNEAADAVVRLQYIMKVLHIIACYFIRYSR